MLAELEPGLGPLLERGQPQLLQAEGGRPHVFLVREVGVRRAAPQPERLGEQRGALPGPGSGAGPGHQRAETVGVGVAGVETQPVPRRLMDDAVAADGTAQLGDLALEGVGGIAGRRPGPQVVDEPVGGDRSALVHQQVGQQRPDLRLAHPDRLPRLVPHHQWTEHPEQHAHDRNPAH